MEPVELPQKPWRQLVFVLGEVALSLVSSGVLFIIISRVSGPELLGTYALAFGWLMLFQGVSSFGLPEFLMREVGAYGREAAGDVVHAMLLGLGSGFVALCLMLAAVRLLGYSAYLVQVISIASLALIPAFFNTACRSVFLALREMHLTVFALVVEVTIVMSASLYLLWSGYGAMAFTRTKAPTAGPMGWHGCRQAAWVCWRASSPSKCSWRRTASTTASSRCGPPPDRAAAQRRSAGPPPA